MFAQELVGALADLKQGVDELRRSKTLKYVLGTLLSIGNCLNNLPVSHSHAVVAKFHYTGPRGPARTRTDPNDPDLRETPLVRAGLRQSPCGSVRVRAGPVGPV